MPTVKHYRYDHLQPGGFQPGTQVRWAFGPWNWAVNGVVVTAHPFDLSTADRALVVTEVRLRSRPGQPVGQKFVEATIRNVGTDPVVIYYIAVIEILP
jgi:hypothetical protein